MDKEGFVEIAAMLRHHSLSVTALFVSVFFSALPAYAQDATFSDIAYNMVASVEFLPGLISGLAYLFALVLAVTGIIQLKGYVENPGQTPLKNVIIRLFAAGGLFSLPIILEAMATTIGGDGFGFGSFVDALAGTFGLFVGDGADGSGVNEIFGNIVTSIEFLPGLISGVSYLLGLVLGYSAILKIKEHVENDQVKLSEGVIRLLIGGALFSLPAIYEAMVGMIAGDSFGVGGFLASLFGGDILSSNQADLQCGELRAGSFGDFVCHAVISASYAPSFLNAFAYLFGLVLGVWALLKIRDHVLDPRQTNIWEGVSRLVAGGMFFALPYVIEVSASTVVGGGGFFGAANTGFNDQPSGDCGSPAGLDLAMYCLMQDVLGPVHALINFFALVAGIIFIMVGISRLMKSAQEGAKGPGGIGTLMTFLTGGILISFNSILGAFSETLFANPTVRTIAVLSYDDGLGGDEIAHVETVISAIIKFMIVVGLISFVRGWFIMRDVAEGNNQASAMAGTTHIIGGALAVNLGPLLDAVQTTLGISGIGVEFH